MKLKTFARSALAASIAALGLAAGSANAYILFPYTTLQDDNREKIIDVNNNGLLDAGDKLRAVIEIKAIEDTNGSGDYNIGIGSQPELTGLSEIEVKSAIDVLGDQSFWIFSFGPSASFQTELAGMGVPPAPVGVGNGIMVAFWTDPANNLDLVTCTSVANCEAAATDGTLWATGGFAGDKDAVWGATSAFGNVIQDIRDANSATNVASFNYRLEVLYNGTGVALLDQSYKPCTPNATKDCMIQVIGGGSVVGGQGLTNGYDARSDFDFSLKVPEPGNLALLGLAAIGIGATSRRKFAKA